MRLQSKSAEQTGEKETDRAEVRGGFVSRLRRSNTEIRSSQATIARSHLALAALEKADQILSSPPEASRSQRVMDTLAAARFDGERIFAGAEIASAGSGLAEVIGSLRAGHLEIVEEETRRIAVHEVERANLMAASQFQGVSGPEDVQALLQTVRERMGNAMPDSLHVPSPESIIQLV